jgi:uncharacterized protein YjcR
MRKVSRPSAENLLVDAASMTLDEIGKKYGVNRTTIRRWQKIYGIFTENRKETNE